VKLCTKLGKNGQNY